MGQVDDEIRVDEAESHSEKSAFAPTTMTTTTTMVPTPFASLAVLPESMPTPLSLRSWLNSPRMVVEKMTRKTLTTTRSLRARSTWTRMRKKQEAKLGFHQSQAPCAQTLK